MVDSDDENSWRLAIEIEEKLKSLPLSGKYKIFNLPRNLRGGEDFYTPRVVSIGPLHHGKDILQAMENHKMRYVSNCLCYNPNITVEDLVESLNGLEETVRGTYNPEHFPREFSRNEFVNMMLFDGCFILHLFILNWNRAVAPDYDREMFATDFLKKDVDYDLKLVENQLPFFLLEHLFNFILTDEQRGSHSFLTIATDYFKRFVEMGGNVFDKENVDEFKHFGDILLNCFLPSITYVKPSDSKRFDALPTVSELHKLGVQIKKSENLNLLDITFTNGVLAIPKLRMTGSVRSIFRNIIAMEQCHPGSNNYVTDYMILMNYLVDTSEDVRLLKSCEVIDSYLGNDERATKLFNSMTDGVNRSTKNLHYYGIIHEINVYSKGSWNQWKANVRKDYFSSPLTVLSLIAALTLLVCTIVGSVFTVLSFTK